MGVEIPVREAVEVLRGRHRALAIERYALVIVFAALFGWMAVSILREGGSMVPALAMLAIAVVAVSDSFAVYEISPVAIEKRLPVRGTVWKVSVGDIRNITASWYGRWRLTITTSTGAKRELPLVGSMHVAFATAYPEIDARRRAMVRH